MTFQFTKNSEELLKVSNDLLDLLNNHHHFYKYLEIISQSYDDLFPRFLGAMGAQGNSPPNELSQLFATIREAVNKLNEKLRQEIDTDEIAISRNELKTKLKEFAILAPDKKADIEIIQSQIKDFASASQAFVKYFNYPNLLNTLLLGRQLYFSLTSFRQAIKIITIYLEIDPDYERLREQQLAILSISFPSGSDTTTLIDKLTSLTHAYVSSCILLGVSEEEYPLTVIRIEAGSFLLTLLGYLKAINLIEKVAGPLLDYWHRNYTEEGKAKWALDLRKALQEQGIDTTDMDKGLATYGKNVVTNLIKMQAGEETITINGTTYKRNYVYTLEKRMLPSEEFGKRPSFLANIDQPSLTPSISADKPQGNPEDTTDS